MPVLILLMKKTWHIVLAHLLVQAVVGSLIVYAADKEFTGPLGGLGTVFTYLATAGSFFVLSLILPLFVEDKQVRHAFRRSILPTLLLWALAPFLVSAGSSVINDIENRRYEREASERNKLLGMQLIKELDLKSCTWNPATSYYDMPLDKGRRCSFISDGEHLWIAANIKPLPGRDSLGWARLAMDYARPFLKPALAEQFDSLVQAGSLKHEYDGGGEFGQVRVGIFSRAYVNVGKSVDASFYPQDPYNFSVHVPLKMQPIKADDQKR